MAETSVTTKDIQDYGEYLKSQGQKHEDVESYKQYLASHHGIEGEGLTKNLDKPYEQSFMNAGVLGFKTPREAIKSGLGALPAAGQVGGGLLGGIGGAAVGGALGETGKAAGERYILGEEKPTSDVLKDIAIEGGKGALYETGGLALKGAGKYLANTGAGKKALGWLGSKASEVGEAFTGIPAQEIKTYGANVPEINKMAKDAGGSKLKLADQARGKINEAVDTTRQSLNSQIGDALKDKWQQNIKTQDIINDLNKFGTRLDPEVNKPDLEQIHGLIDEVRRLSDENGEMGLQRAYALKRKYQEMASGAYKKDGQAFQLGSQAAQGARGAAAELRKGLHAASPEIAAGDTGLARLHGQDDMLNPNMLQTGKTANSIMGAGAGTNEAQAEALSRLGEITNSDALGEAQKAAAASRFASAPWLPVDSTGKSFTRMAAAGMLGAQTHSPEMTMAALAATSPKTLKGLINAGYYSGKALSVPEIQGLLLREANQK